MTDYYIFNLLIVFISCHVECSVYIMFFLYCETLCEFGFKKGDINGIKLMIHFTC